MFFCFFFLTFAFYLNKMNQIRLNFINKFTWIYVEIVILCMNSLIEKETKRSV